MSPVHSLTLFQPLVTLVFPSPTHRSQHDFSYTCSLSPFCLSQFSSHVPYQACSFIALPLQTSVNILVHLLLSLTDQEANFLWEFLALPRFKTMNINGNMAGVPLENIKSPKKLDPEAEMLLCCLWLFFYLYKGGACLRNETLPKRKVHKKPCQKLEGL